MKKFLILLFSVIYSVGFTQTDTLKQDLNIVCDTVGLRQITYNGLLTFHAGTTDGYGSESSIDIFPYNSVMNCTGNNIRYELQTTSTNLSLVSYYNSANNLGTRFYLNGYDAIFYDTRPIKKGLQYSLNGYVTQPTSITDKEYVDRNQLTLKTKTTLPSASPSGRMIFVTNASGGPVPAYSDGTNWRRVTDGTVIN